MNAPKKQGVAALSLLILAFAGVTLAAPAPLPKRDRRTERQPLLGTWKLVSVNVEGTEVTKALVRFQLHWVIEAHKIRVFSKGKVESHGWNYRFYAAQEPAMLDLTVIGGPWDGVTYPCIYKLGGDRLTVLLQNFPELGRPREFTPPRTEIGLCWRVFVRVRSGEVE